MRNARRQGTQRRQLFGIDELALEALAVGNVAGDSQNYRFFAVLLADRNVMQIEPEILPWI